MNINDGIYPDRDHNAALACLLEACLFRLSARYAWEIDPVGWSLE